MLVLSETTDKLQVVLSGAITTNQLQCVASWRDITATPTYVAGRTVVDTNSTTDVDLVASPAASTQRLIDYISVFNADTASAIVIVKYDANGTDRTLYRGTLAVNETLTYHEDSGWSKLNSNGSLILVGETGATGSSLSEVAITDGDVTMIANRRYCGSTAGFTVDHNYEVPAGSAGDVIEIHVLTGDDTYELIIIGDTGVSINNGTAATEWSRLCIDGEFVRIRCNITNDWHVEIDGRKPQLVKMPGSAVSSVFVSNTYSKMPVGAATISRGNSGDNTNDQITVRRDGLYRISGNVNYNSSTDHDVACAYNVGGTRYIRSSHGYLAHNADEQTRIAMSPEIFPMTDGQSAYIEVRVTDTTRTSQLDSFLCLEEILE